MLSERGEGAVERVRELTGGHGAHSVLECVGNGESILTALSIARAGGAVGRVGVPQEATIPAVLRPFVPTLKSCCQTCLRAGSSRAACSTALSGSKKFLTATGQ